MGHQPLDDRVPGDGGGALAPGRAESRRVGSPPSSRCTASAIAAGVGVTTKPFTPSSTNSSVPPESVAVTTGLAARNPSSVTRP